jgi:hypothetical protein
MDERLLVIECDTREGLATDLGLRDRVVQPLAPGHERRLQASKPKRLNTREIKCAPNRRKLKRNDRRLRFAVEPPPSTRGRFD